MKKIIFKAAIIVSLLYSNIVFALGLDNAKQQGLVGEKDNGYLGVVIVQSNTQKEMQTLLDEISNKRKSVYAKLAAKNGITLQQVEKVAAVKAYEITSPGHYLWKNGQWTKK